MLSDDILVIHKKECETRISEMSDYLASDKCSDFSEYKKMTGKIRGVRMSLEIIEDSMQRYNNDEDIEEDENGE